MEEIKETREYPGLPRVAVGAVVVHEGRFLMVRRGRSPAGGLWAIPGGMVELGETMQQAAEREIAEETGLIIRAKEPIFSFEIIDRDREGRVRFHYVIIDLAAELVGGDLREQGGDDARAAAWFSPGELEGLSMSDMTRRLIAEKFSVLPDGEQTGSKAGPRG